MTNPDLTNDPMPRIDSRSYPRSGAELTLAQDQIELFNLAVDRAIEPEKRKAAKNRLSILAAGGPPFGMYLLKLLDWYVERHPEIKPLPMSLGNIPRPPALPKRPISPDPPPDSLFSGQP